MSLGVLFGGDECQRCNTDHANYFFIERALDIAMEESNDSDCRTAARRWIIANFSSRKVSCHKCNDTGTVHTANGCRKCDCK